MGQIEEFVAHYGKKGMRWGTRNSKLVGNIKRVSRNNKQVNKTKPKAKDLSDDELRAAVNRIQLERQYNSLVAGKSPARKVSSFISSVGTTALKTAVTAIATQQVGAALKKVVTKPKS